MPELEITILTVAAIAVLLCIVLISKISKMDAAHKKLLDNQKVHNNLLLIIADKLNIDPEERKADAEKTDREPKQQRS